MTIYRLILCQFQHYRDKYNYGKYFRPLSNHDEYKVLQQLALFIRSAREARDLAQSLTSIINVTEASDWRSP